MTQGFQDLDRVIHEKARLAILTALAAAPKGLSFTQLKKTCDLTDGNLSRHIQTLADANLVTVEKGFEGNRPLTQCQITPEGQRRFDDYLNLLESLVREAIAARDTASLRAKPA